MDNKILPIAEEDLLQMIKYLKQKGHEQKLKRREYVKKAGRKWYEIWNTRDPENMEKSLKIVVPDINLKNDFAIDYQGRYVDGSAYFILLEKEKIQHYRYILGLLNSSVIEFYYKLTSGNRIYAKRYRYWTQYMKSIPLILEDACDEKLRNNLIEIVEQLEKQYSLTLERKLNEIVFQIYGIEQDQRQSITEWVNNSRIS